MPRRLGARAQGRCQAGRLAPGGPRL